MVVWVRALTHPRLRPGHAMCRELRRPHSSKPCLVRAARVADPPDVPCVSLSHAHVLRPHPLSPSASVGEMLCTSICSILSEQTLNTCHSPGFLPVLYSLLRARRQSQPLHLPADSEEEPAAGAKAEVPLARLHGWKVLLLWFPAACDLTGTTVRPACP